MSKPHKISTKAKLRFNYYRFRLEASKFWENFSHNKRKAPPELYTFNSEDDLTIGESNAEDTSVTSTTYFNFTDDDSRVDDIVHYDSTSDSKSTFTFQSKHRQLNHDCLSSTCTTGLRKPVYSDGSITQNRNIVNEFQINKQFQQYQDLSSMLLNEENEKTDTITKFGTLFPGNTLSSIQIRPTSVKTNSSDESQQFRYRTEDNSERSRRRRRSSRTSRRHEYDYIEIGRPFSAPITEGDQYEIPDESKSLDLKRGKQGTEEIILDTQQEVPVASYSKQTISRSPSTSLHPSENVPSFSRFPKVSDENVSVFSESPALSIYPEENSSKEAVALVGPVLSDQEKISTTLPLEKQNITSPSVSLQLKVPPAGILIPQKQSQTRKHEPMAFVTAFKDRLVGLTKRRRNPSVYNKPPLDFQFGIKFVYRSEPIRQRDIDRERKRDEKAAAKQLNRNDLDRNSVYDEDDDHDGTFLLALAKLILPRSLIESDYPPPEKNVKKVGKKKAINKNIAEVNLKPNPMMINKTSGVGRVDMTNSNDRYKAIQQSYFTRISRKLHQYSTPWNHERKQSVTTSYLEPTTPTVLHEELGDNKLDLSTNKLDLENNNKELNINVTNMKVEAEEVIIGEPDMKYQPKSTFTSQFTSLLKISTD